MPIIAWKLLPWNWNCSHQKSCVYCEWVLDLGSQQFYLGYCARIQFQTHTAGKGWRTKKKPESHLSDRSFLWEFRVWEFKQLYETDFREMWVLIWAFALLDVWLVVIQPTWTFISLCLNEMSPNYHLMRLCWGLKENAFQKHSAWNLANFSVNWRCYCFTQILSSEHSRLELLFQLKKNPCLMFMVYFSQKCYKITLKRQRAIEMEIVPFVTINEQRCPNLKRQKRVTITQHRRDQPTRLASFKSWFSERVWSVSWKLSKEKAQYRKRGVSESLE